MAPLISIQPAPSGRSPPLATVVPRRPGAANPPILERPWVSIKAAGAARRRIQRIVTTGVLGGILGTLAFLSAATAAESVEACLSQDQRRAAIAGHQAMPLGKAMAGLKAHVPGEIVRARLCDHGKGLVYVLTVLRHDGKVTREHVDAVSGALIEQPH